MNVAQQHVTPCRNERVIDKSSSSDRGAPAAQLNR